jgi:hypothetical protein
LQIWSGKSNLEWEKLTLFPLVGELATLLPQISGKTCTLLGNCRKNKVSRPEA